MNETLEERITRHEGFRGTAYKDTLGNWTIGIGHFLLPPEVDNYSNGISYADAAALLESDISKVKLNCAKEFPWLLGLDDVRQEVIWELGFWIGVGGVSKFVHMIATIRDQNWQAASNALLDSKLHAQIPKRTEELAALLLTGTDTASN